MSQTRNDENISMLWLAIANVFILIIYWVIWILGFPISSLGDFIDDISTLHLLMISFASFFIVSMLSFWRFLRKPTLPLVLSITGAFSYSCVLYVLIVVSNVVLGPFLNPMF